MNIEAMKQWLSALEAAQDNLRPHGDNCFLHDEGQYNRCFCGKDSLSDYLQEQVENLSQAIAEAEKQKPVAFPPVQFEKVADGIEIGYDFVGGVDIRLGGEFVYVHINYDYRYTDNAGRRRLAGQIIELLTHPQPKREWVGLTERERAECWYGKNCHEQKSPQDDYACAIETKLKEKNT